MQNTFEFVGKITPCKATESFKPYGTTQFPGSDWGRKQIKFNVVAGNNRHIVEVSDLVNVVNPNSMKVYTTAKNVDGTYENLNVAFKDRFDPDLLAKVAPFKKFVIDTDFYDHRADLEAAVDKFADGTITDEQMNYLGVSGIEACMAALDKSRGCKQEFMSAYDFIDRVNDVVNSPETANMLFRVTGQIEFEYNEAKDIWYRKFMVSRIYRVKPDTPTCSKGVVDFFFAKDAVDDSDFDESGKIHVNGYVSQYLSKFKKSFMCPLSLTIDGAADDTAKKKAKVWAKKFNFADSDSEYREIGVQVDILNGSQKVELTMDMLTDEQRENVEFGLCTLDDIVREMGGDVYGDRVQDIVLSGVARGFSNGARDTAYTEEDFAKPHNSLDDDDDDDIFDDDDEI